MARLGVSTVADFELARRDVAPESIGKVRQALEAAGVAFIGAKGVRLK
jgi:hypothetical protein